MPDQQHDAQKSQVVDTSPQRIAINCGGAGYVPGLNAVVTGAVLAGSRLGTEIVGIRDGYNGLLDEALSR
jgi:ATP-dependent phosphofructokinase / diphosphate-dependent phosphofructokinase